MRTPLLLAQVVIVLFLAGIAFSRGQAPSADGGVHPLDSITVFAGKNTGSVKARFKQVLDREWEKVNPNRDEHPGRGPPRVFWNYQISPAFPSEWPPRRAAPLYYYLYASGIDAQVVDAERLSKPWARLDIRRNSDGSAQLQILSKGISEIGLQGVRPLTEEEASVYALEPQIEAYLQSSDSVPQDTTKEAELLRSYYCAWSGDRGVVGEIQPYHESFFSWLLCDEIRRGWARRR